MNSNVIQYQIHEMNFQIIIIKLFNKDNYNNKNKNKKKIILTLAYYRNITLVILIANYYKALNNLRI